MRWTLALVVALVACNDGGDKGSDTDDSTLPYPFECDVTAKNDLSDPFAPIDGAEHVCEESPNYVESVPWSTSYFVGEFHWDDCGNVFGEEYYLLHMNPRWVELGGHDCQIAYNMSGTATKRGSDWILEVSASLDASSTTCQDIQNDGSYFMDYQPTTYDVTYEVAVLGGEATFFFESGTELGRGSGNGNHANYTSSQVCQAF